jgi:isopenicillin-N N-acyltransferase-like protein
VRPKPPTTHRSRERSPGDRGRALGHTHAGAIANTAEVYRRLFSEDVGLDEEEVHARGGRVARRLTGWRPDLAEEISGIAHGAGQPEPLMFAVNARTELLAGGELAGGARECSVAGTVAGEACLLAQNWDFHPDLAASRLLWTVEDGGRWFTTLTEAGGVAKTGISSSRLAVTLNALASDADGGVDGVPIHLLLRALLDRAEDFEDAARLIGSTPLSASACVTVAHTSPRKGCALASYELTPRGVQAIPADERGLLAHTNHFIGRPGVGDVVLARSGAASTLSRLDQVTRDLRRLDAERPLAGLTSMLSSRRDGDGHEPVFRDPEPGTPWTQLCATLATVVYDVKAPRMWLRVSEDPGANLEEVPLPGR